ncbi:hypothetical protein SAMN02746041_03236 [Desulfacinum hydrothermale DSM 13146]|uniref:Uncharacterized protein n=2 Tax=Desulfacinum hydrothermale TaxID=109258 RepID=A0A1W1XWT3_9BACT|nr:hypothetical protein SAMN02746041_03236 [Desulfacinum hydrothermale DSM 13146]
MKRRRITIRVDETLLQQLTEWGENTLPGAPVSVVVRTILYRYLRGFRPESDFAGASGLAGNADLSEQAREQSPVMGEPDNLVVDGDVDWLDKQISAFTTEQ